MNEVKYGIQQMVIVGFHLQRFHRHSLEDSPTTLSVDWAISLSRNQQI
jgi:hypothetical protein